MNHLDSMKVAALLAATASANPTQFIMDNWWKEAVNVFNFASGNWDQFSSTVDTVSLANGQNLAMYNDR